MKIEWNKVTWYSKLAAIIIFVAVFFLGFWLGTQKTEKVYIEVPHVIHRGVQYTDPSAVTSPSPVTVPMKRYPL